MRSLKQLALPLALLALALTGCGGGYGDEEAADRCVIEQNNNGACFDQATYDSCVACFSECGDSCATAESCPLTYVCAE